MRTGVKFFTKIDGKIAEKLLKIAKNLLKNIKILRGFPIEFTCKSYRNYVENGFRRHFFLFFFAFFLHFLHFFCIFFVDRVKILRKMRILMRFLMTFLEFLRHDDEIFDEFSEVFVRKWFFLQKKCSGVITFFIKKWRNELGHGVPEDWSQHFWSRLMKIFVHWLLFFEKVRLWQEKIDEIINCLWNIFFIGDHFIEMIVEIIFFLSLGRWKWENVRHDEDIFLFSRLD